MKKLFLSEESTKMFENALDSIRKYNFDAINVPILIGSILDLEDSILYQYISDYGEYDDWDDPDVDMYARLAIERRRNELKIEPNDTDKINSDCEDLRLNLNLNYEVKVINDGNSFNIEINPIEKETKAILSQEEDSNEDIKFKSELRYQIDIECYDGKRITIPSSEEFKTLFDSTINICEENSIEEIKPLHFIIALFNLDNQVLKTLFQNLEVDYYAAKREFTNNSFLSNAFSIPYELVSFLNILNDKVDISKPCEILMREKEVETLWNIMLKRNKRNAVIVGEAGVGKTALIEKITYEICKGTCPSRFKGFLVINLDVNALIAGTSFRGQAEERIMNLISFLENNNNIILFIDEVHTILGAGSCFQGEMDLSNALKPILARGDTIVIGATTMEEYERFFCVDAALSRRFEKLEVKEPLSNEVYPMIKNKIKDLSDYHGVKISKSFVEYTILIASCFAFEKNNPDKTLDLIDRAMVTASRDGKKTVDKESVLKNFAIYFKLFDNMSEASKKEIAFHEAGHYIVGRASKRLIEYRYLAVSIMPSEDYSGVTVHEELEDRVPFKNLDYYIDQIAFFLGGRVAEKIFTNDYTSGACKDLYYTTEFALFVITKLGMGTDTIKNRIYLNNQDYSMFSESSTNLINEEVNKLVEKAYCRAEEIIHENDKLLKVLVKQLLKKQILSGIELERIWKKYGKSM